MQEHELALRGRELKAHLSKGDQHWISAAKLIKEVKAATERAVFLAWLKEYGKSERHSRRLLQWLKDPAAAEREHRADREHKNAVRHLTARAKPGRFKVEKIQHGGKTKVKPLARIIALCRSVPPHRHGELLSKVRPVVQAILKGSE